MEKVILNYDSASGQILDKNGTVVGNWIGLVPFVSDKKENKDSLALDLKYDGMSDDNVMLLIK